ncbi:HAD family hydrolase [Rhodococcus tukisamuensis]|uniref:Haloacid dehalogenase superfamily, subfamily IA, variant 3 with third motif having DD or ED n=1 Tax=Rhodococcus tukisamuensis TaxID=168276 RepID=A0A1G6U840_9NOCA|nr:HAD family phosphatase [Rhodococcus tukisamuensis]SDD36725.1 haloacid dehalogenase superfamily, subfamily IA, variant 3 with third motif having DD or ED [Rhodococcus tukisamuensis]
MPDLVLADPAVVGVTLEGVLWDMDGTLLDSEKLWDVAMGELATELGGVMTEQMRHAVLGASAPDALARIFAALDLDPTPTAVAGAGDWINARVTELFALGIPWRPGARDALRAVRAVGLRTALVTNTERELAEQALDTLGREHFDVTVCGDEVPSGKPQPDPYLRAAALLGLEPAQCLAIEDSPTGAAAAVAAGCAVLVVPCEVDVPTGPRRVHRTTLEGMGESMLASVWRAAHA